MLKITGIESGTPIYAYVLAPSYPGITNPLSQSTQALATSTIYPSAQYLLTLLFHDGTETPLYRFSSIQYSSRGFLLLGATLPTSW